MCITHHPYSSFSIPINGVFLPLESSYLKVFKYWFSLPVNYFLDEVPILTSSLCHTADAMWRVFGNSAILSIAFNSHKLKTSPATRTPPNWNVPKKHAYTHRVHWETQCRRVCALSAVRVCVCVRLCAQRVTCLHTKYAHIINSRFQMCVRINTFETIRGKSS